MALTYRGSFGSIIKNDGLDGLITRLEKRKQKWGRSICPAVRFPKKWTNPLRKTDKKTITSEIKSQTDET